MMPPEQEIGKVSRTPAINPRPDAVTVHAEPMRCEFVDHTSNANSCLDVHAMERRPAVPCQRSTPWKPPQPVTLKFEDVGFILKLQSKEGCCLGPPVPKADRVVLNGVTGVVYPGELMAMLGPSGSGKTTLLTALAGRLKGKISGSITYNGRPFSGPVKRRTGFVTQDDVLYPHLTVLETLTYAAMLRLPNSLTKQEKINQAESVIHELGLTRCTNSIIGGPLLRGVSGGERKRVSIGHEMLVNPSLLLLDEPTSGLDSTTAQKILATLQGLARRGRTVVTTIHQPSSRLYEMFDKVVVLSEGCPIYSGSASWAIEYFNSLGFAAGANVNPADFLLDLANGITPDSRQGDHQLESHARPETSDQNSVRQSLVSSYKKNIYHQLKSEIQQNCIDTNASANRKLACRSNEKPWSTTWWEQFMVLLRRGLKERKHESFAGLRIFQVMSVSVLAGLLWWHSSISHIQDQVGLLFFFSIFWGFFPMFNAIFTFPQERSMLIKERSSGMYRLSSYFFARMAGDLPMELVLPTIFVVVTYWMGGLRPSPANFIYTVLVILCNVLVSQGLGLAVGAVLMDVKQATTLASVIMLAFLLAGGYYVEHFPPFMTWIKYISLSYYCYKLLLGVQYTEHDFYECGEGAICRVVDYPPIKQMGIDHKGYAVLTLTMMLVGYRFVAYMALRKRKIH